MLRRLLFVALALAFALPAAASVVVTREFDSTALQRKWSYAVYLPDGYDTSNLKYPVLYLLHGHNQDLYAWANFGHIQSTADTLIARGEIPPAVIVMPDAGMTWYVDRKEKMETAVIQDLLGDVQHTFRVIEARNGRIIAGLSMGGYGALRFVLKYPEMFAAAGLLSPAIYDPEVPQGSGARRAGVFGASEFDPQVWKELNYPALWEAFLAKKIAVPMYINSGDDDDFFIEAEATRLYSLLRKNGQPAELRIVDGAHKWPVWESTIGDAMRYVFRYAARPALVTDAKARKSR
ncbi:MAG TPA: alpha/beta hydrolase family protein [Steroidobacteraceae bacterium]|nr:alpha/beta hydrolase family protein [Steroidobacteraceae bacterium]